MEFLYFIPVETGSEKNYCNSREVIYLQQRRNYNATPCVVGPCALRYQNSAASLFTCFGEWCMTKSEGRSEYSFFKNLSLFHICLHVKMLKQCFRTTVLWIHLSSSSITVRDATNRLGRFQWEVITFFLGNSLREKWFFAGGISAMHVSVDMLDCYTVKQKSVEFTIE